MSSLWNWFPTSRNTTHPDPGLRTRYNPKLGLDKRVDLAELDLPGGSERPVQAPRFYDDPMLHPPQLNARLTTHLRPNNGASVSFEPSLRRPSQSFILQYSLRIQIGTATVSPRSARQITQRFNVKSDIRPLHHCDRMSTPSTSSPARQSAPSIRSQINRRLLESGEYDRYSLPLCC